MKPADHELNSGGVPDGFQPLVLEIPRKRRGYIPPSILRSESVKRTEIGSAAAVGGYAIISTWVLIGAS